MVGRYPMRHWIGRSDVATSVRTAFRYSFASGCPLSLLLPGGRPLPDSASIGRHPDRVVVVGIEGDVAHDLEGQALDFIPGLASVEAAEQSVVGAGVKALGILGVGAEPDGVLAVEDHAPGRA